MRPETLLIFLAICFVGCTKEISPKSAATDRFLRQWNVVRYPYSNASLTISSNHIFKYEETGHLQDYYSTGTWRLDKDTLILNSTVPAECLYIDDFSLNQQQTSDHLTTTVKNCEPDAGRKFYTDFNEAKFIVTTDSLKYLNLNPDYKKLYGNYRIY